MVQLALLIGERKVENIINTYDELSNKALTHEFLHHFTSIDSFKMIIDSQKLLLNRIDKVEDKTENEFLPDFWSNKIFISCFTHSDEGKKDFGKNMLRIMALESVFLTIYLLLKISK